MNRFLPKKKPRAEAPPVEVISRSDVQPIQPVPAPHNWAWGKKKAQAEPTVEEPVPAPVLPSSDNFRTSLIMPNLSARFSMLREQDDPASPLGKAKDDSVLSPKRRSRLIDFGHVPGTLTDIVEISSTTKTIVTPIEPRRKASYTYGETNDVDDIFSTESSMVNRGRAVESKPLFGSPEKTYRVPAQPRDGVGHRATHERQSPQRVLNPTLVDKDARQTTPQKLRTDEKQSLRSTSTSLTSRSSPTESNVSSRLDLEKLPFHYDAKRDMTSALTSGPPLQSTSTVATSDCHQSPAPALPISITSQVSKLPIEKTSSKQSYQHSLSKQMHEQQSAAITRLNSTKYQGAGLNRLPSQSVSTIRDQLERKDSTAVRKALPPLELDKLTTFDSLRKGKSSKASTDKALPRPPLSPFEEDSELTNILYAAMHPSDRGKATAMAQFQKPKKFDEQQYLQRQMSLIQQQQRRKRRSVLSPAKKPTFPGKTASPNKPQRPKLLIETRPRAGTNDSNKSWSACSDHDESKGFSVVKPVEDSERASNAGVPCDGTRTSPLKSVSNVARDEDSHDEQAQEHNQISTSEVSISTPFKQGTSPILGVSASPSPGSPEAKERRNGWSPEKLMSGMASGSLFFKDEQNVNSPPANQNSFLSADNAGGSDLKGLVRTHLRQTSNVSSSSPSPAFQRPISVFQNLPSMYGPESSSVFNFDGEQLLTRPANRPVFPNLKALAAESGTIGSLRQHTRGGSTETQHERVAFAKELADRQKAIQENLRIKVESRSPSPVHNGRNVFEHPFKSLGMLRAMSSRDSMSHRHEAPVRNYGWVDMSIGEFESGDNKKLPVDVRVRSISPTGVGRTLHSRMRETKPVKQGDLRARRPQRHGINRNAIPERSSPRKNGHRFSRVLAESARNSIIALTTSERSSTVQLEGGSGAGEVSLNSSPAKDEIEPPIIDNQAKPKTTTRAAQRSSNTTPQRPTSKIHAPRKNDDVDQTVEKERNSSVLEPNTPASVAQSSTNTLNSTTTTPSTVATSTFSTPNLASSNSSIETPKTIYSMSTNSPRLQDTSPIIYQKTSTFNQPPTKPVIPRAPLADLFSQSHNLRNRKIPQTAGPAPFIKKSDISEPTLIASTSTVNTVPLPHGASLQNGMGTEADVDVVLASRNLNTTPIAGGSREGVGLGLQQPTLVRRPWDGKENERRVGMEKEGVVKEKRIGFLARMGRVASSEKKGDWW